MIHWDGHVPSDHPASPTVHDVSALQYNNNIVFGLQACGRDGLHELVRQPRQVLLLQRRPARRRARRVRRWPAGDAAAAVAPAGPTAAPRAAGVRPDGRRL